MSDSDKSQEQEREQEQEQENTRMSDSEKSPLLEARGISRRGADDSLLLDYVSLRIHRGERWAIIGPTGSGKTVLLRALSLLDEIHSGEILWNGMRVANHEVPEFRRQIVYLQQRPALVEGNVETNLRLPYSFAINKDRKFDRDACVAKLAQLGFEESFLAKQSRDLSGGESQVTSILRALQTGPTVLLLDEPTSALDRDSAKRVESLISGWFQESPEQRAVLWVTHQLEQAQRVAEKQIVLQKGRRLEDY